MAVVRTQAELDAALASAEQSIIIDAQRESPLVLTAGMPGQVTAVGVSRVAVAAGGMLTAAERSYAWALDQSNVTARDRAHVEAFDDAAVVASGDAHVIAAGDSSAIGFDRSILESAERATAVGIGSRTVVDRLE